MRIAVVNDNPVAVEGLRRTLSREPHLRVIWTAADGASAVRRCAEDRPDLILMDLVMPVLNGVEATRRIMALSPCPILIVTASIRELSETVFQALSAGALDAVQIPAIAGPRASVESAALLFKIARLARMTSGSDSEAVAAPSAPAAPVQRGSGSLVAIGASAGGPAAVAEVLSHLPADFSGSTIVVQHLDERFASGLASWLGGKSILPVKIAQEGDSPMPGTVLVAGTSDHLSLTRYGTLTYSSEPAASSYRPSIDVFFHSAVKNWRGAVIGVLLTGMGRDGAAGLKAIRSAGHHTIAQDSATSAVYGMPKAAEEIGAAAQILPLPRIASALIEHVHSTSCHRLL